MSMMTEPSDPTFRLFHRYNKLVRRGLVQPLMCKTDQVPYVTGLGEDGDLVLRCYACASKIVPGLATISMVRAVVTEHFLDED